MSQKKTHFWLPELYDLSLPPTCIIWSFCCGGLTYEWSSRHGDPHSSWFQALPNTEAASHWLVGPGHKVAGCRYLGVPRASTGSLVDRARFWGVSSKAGVPRSSAHLLMGKTERPLLKGKSSEELVSFIKEQLNVREPFYNKARYQLDVSLMDNYDKIKITVAKLKELLQED